MRTSVYANYGVLAHEYQTIYTANAPHCHATVSDKLEVEIPDEFDPYLNVNGAIVITVPGVQWKHTLDEVIGCMDSFPAICWYDGSKKYHKIMLRVVSGAERLN